MRSKEKGSFDKWGKRDLLGRAQKIDHGRNAYRDGDGALQTFGGPFPGGSPLVNEFPLYLDWGRVGERR